MLCICHRVHVNSPFQVDVELPRGTSHEIEPLGVQHGLPWGFGLFGPDKAVVLGQSHCCLNGVPDLTAIPADLSVRHLGVVESFRPVYDGSLVHQEVRVACASPDELPFPYLLRLCFV